jgi:hypothetical protein
MIVNGITQIKDELVISGGLAIANDVRENWRTGLEVYSKNEITDISVEIKAYTANLEPFESVSTYIQPKSGYNGDSLRLYTENTTYTVAGSGGADGFTNAGTNLLYTGGYYQNKLTANADPFNNGAPQTDNNTPYGTTASVDGGNAWKALDTDINTACFDGTATMPFYWTLDVLSTKELVKLGYYGNDGQLRGGLGSFEVRGSNDPSFSSYTVLISRTGQSYSNGIWNYWNFDTTGSFRYYRLHVTAGTAGDNRIGLWSLRFYEGVPTTTLNTIETLNLVPSGTKSFAPGTLIVLDGTGSLTPVPDNLYNVAYSTDGVNFSTLISGTAFKALSVSLFANLASLKLKVQPIGTQTIGTVKISTPSTEGFMTNNDFFTTLNGIETHRLSNKADTTALSGYVQTFNGRYGNVSGAQSDYDFTATVNTEAEFVTAMSNLNNGPYICGRIVVAQSFTLASNVTVSNKNLFIVGNKIGYPEATITATNYKINFNKCNVTFEDIKFVVDAFGVGFINVNTLYPQSNWATINFTSCNIYVTRGYFVSLQLYDSCSVNFEGCIVEANNSVGPAALITVAGIDTSPITTYGNININKTKIVGTVVINGGCSRANTFIGGGCYIVDQPGGLGCWNRGSPTYSEANVYYDGAGSTVTKTLVSGSSPITFFNMASGSELRTELASISGYLAALSGSGSSGSYVSLLPTSISGNLIRPLSGSYVPLTIQGVSGQTADFFNIMDVDGVSNFKVNSTGISVQQGKKISLDPYGYTYISSSTNAQFRRGNDYVLLQPAQVRIYSQDTEVAFFGLNDHMSFGAGSGDIYFNKYSGGTFLYYGYNSDWLDINAGLRLQRTSVAAVSGGITLLTPATTVLVVSGGAFDQKVNLPAPFDRKLYTIKNRSAGTLTISGSGCTIDGGSPVLSLSPNDAYTLLCNGSDWAILNNKVSTATTQYVDSAVSTSSLSNVVSITTSPDIPASGSGNLIYETTGTFTFNLPANLENGFNFTIVKQDASTTVTLSGGSSSLNSKNSATKLTAQYSAANVYYKGGSNTWVAIGDLTA